jgi:aryl-phospho-beta-D-glucosidase BglC (GH1 family)
MNKILAFLSFLLINLSCIGQSTLNPLSPQEAIRQMIPGINLGNTLEPPTEGGWNNPAAQEYYFDDYKAAGFTCVRIPVRWDEHTDKKPPYAIDKAWMDRVEQIADWGLKRDLFIILNTHHEEWIKKGYADPNQRERFDSIWRQISQRFKDKSEKLFFEVINEPVGLSLPQINELNDRILKIIRLTNPVRIVVYSGNEWNGFEPLIKAAVPKDKYLIGTFHTYDPSQFALEGKGKWGTDADKAADKAMFDKVAAWSKETGIPVLVGEFGAVSKCDHDSRIALYTTFVQEIRSHGFAFTVWDDGGDYRIYQRKNRNWNEIKDIVIKTPAPGRVQ